jgi:hypothetical protein
VKQADGSEDSQNQEIEDSRRLNAANAPNVEPRQRNPAIGSLLLKKPRADKDSAYRKKKRYAFYPKVLKPLQRPD